MLPKVTKSYKRVTTSLAGSHECENVSAFVCNCNAFGVWVRLRYATACGQAAANYNSLRYKTACSLSTAPLSTYINLHVFDVKPHAVIPPQSFLRYKTACGRGMKTACGHFVAVIPPQSFFAVKPHLRYKKPHAVIYRNTSCMVIHIYFCAAHISCTLHPSSTARVTYRGGWASIFHFCAVGHRLLRTWINLLRKSWLLML